MATDLIAAPALHRPANRKYERRFFAGMALLILAEMVIGFWPSYAGPGMVEPPLRSPLVRVHGAVFSLWVLLFAAQVGLISARRVKLHRTLGFVGMGLVAAMVALGSLVSFAFLRRTLNYAGYVLVLTELISFAGLMFFALLLRSKPDWHKRLALLAMLPLAEAAITRFHLPWLYGKPLHDDVPLLGMALLLVSYDLFSLRRIHRATLWGLGLPILMFGVRGVLAESAWLHQLTSFLLSRGR